MTEVLQFATAWAIGLVTLYSLELVYDYLSARFQRPAPVCATPAYSLDDIMRLREAMAKDHFRETAELTRPYSDLSIKEGDRIGYQALDGQVFVGTVTSHIETSPGVWSTTLDDVEDPIT